MSFAKITQCSLRRSLVAKEVVSIWPWSGCRDHGADRLVAGVCALLLHMAFLWVYNYVGVLFPITATTAHGLFSLEGNVGRLGVIGVTTSALLAGYGGVATPMIWIPAFNVWARPSGVRRKAGEVRQLQQRLAEAVHCHRLALQAALRAGMDALAVQAAAAPGTSALELDLDAAAAAAVAGAAQCPPPLPPHSEASLQGRYPLSASDGRGSTSQLGEVLPPSGLAAAAPWGHSATPSHRASDAAASPFNVSSLRISIEDPGQAVLDDVDTTQGLTYRSALRLVEHAKESAWAFPMQSVRRGSAIASDGAKGTESGGPSPDEGGDGWCGLQCCCCAWRSGGSTARLPGAERLGAMARVHSTSEQVQTRRMALQLALGGLREMLDASENVRVSGTLVGRLLVMGGWILIAVTASKSLLVRVLNVEQLVRDSAIRSQLCA